MWSNIILKPVFRVDVNECDRGAGICPGNTYCVNRHDSSTFGKVIFSTNRTVFYDSVQVKVRTNVGATQGSPK